MVYRHGAGRMQTRITIAKGDVAAQDVVAIFNAAKTAFWAQAEAWDAPHFQ
jgi:hypothetical protein